MSYKLEFTECKLPPTTNGMTSFHWWKKKKLSDEWNNLVMFHVLKNGAPPKPLQKARLTLTRFSSSEPDYDGLVSSFKVVVDSLRYNAVLADDKMKNIGIPRYDWQKCAPKAGMIHVIVESIDDEI